MPSRRRRRNIRNTRLRSFITGQPVGRSPRAGPPSTPRWRRCRRYRLRKIAIKPVFGQIKQASGFRQFLLRGLEQARQEWTLVCIARNLNKLAAAKA